MRTLLLNTQHYVLEEDRDARVVILRRTALPFGPAAEVRAENERVVAAFRPDHASYGLIVDMRAAPPRNDPAFEAAMRHLRFMVRRSFARTAVLVRTASGMMQVSRMHREEGYPYFTTSDEEEALRLARGD